MRSLDSVQEVISGVINARYNVAVTLSVGGPKDDNTVQFIVLFEQADIGTDLFKVCLLIGSWEEVIGTFLLVGRNEIRIVNRRQGFADKGHVGRDLALEVIIEDLGTLHGFVKGKARYIPTTENEVVGVDHGEDITDGDVDILRSGRVSSNLHSGSAENRADVVGLLGTLLRVPDDVVAIGKNGSAQSRTVVAADTNHHQSEIIERCKHVKKSRMKKRQTQSWKERVWSGIRIPARLA